MLTLFHSGGPVMYPLLLCSLVLLTVIFDRSFLRLVVNSGRENPAQLFAFDKTGVRKRRGKRAEFFLLSLAVVKDFNVLLDIPHRLLPGLGWMSMFDPAALARPLNMSTHKPNPSLPVPARDDV